MGHHDAPEHYEYAGFQFLVEHTDSGPKLTPMPFQHPAAYKEKHRMAATECYVEDHHGQS